jgi:hypothetical protein
MLLDPCCDDVEHPQFGYLIPFVEGGFHLSTIQSCIFHQLTFFLGDYRVIKIGSKSFLICIDDMLPFFLTLDNDNIIQHTWIMEVHIMVAEQSGLCLQSVEVSGRRCGWCFGNYWFGSRCGLYLLRD